MQICIFREKGRQVGVWRIRHVPHLHRDVLQPSNGMAGEEVAQGLLNSMWNARHMGSIDLRVRGTSYFPQIGKLPYGQLTPFNAYVVALSCS